MLIGCCCMISMLAMKICRLSLQVPVYRRCSACETPARACLTETQVLVFLAPLFMPCPAFGKLPNLAASSAKFFYLVEIKARFCSWFSTFTVILQPFAFYSLGNLSTWDNLNPKFVQLAQNVSKAISML